MIFIINRNHRTLIWSALCLVSWLCGAFSSAFAQGRDRSNIPSGSPAETPAQRLLVPPQGGSVDFKQQMLWLQQLKVLMAAGSPTRQSSAEPQFDPEQLQKLLNTMKSLRDQLPDGAINPQPDGNSAEQFSKMMSDPVVREHARKLLEQMSRNGKPLPKKDVTDSRGLPFPRGSNNGGKKNGDKSSENDASLSQDEKNPPAIPSSLQELMNQLAQQARRQREDSSTESDTGSPPRNLPKSNGPRMGTDSSSQPGHPQKNHTAATDRDPITAGTLGPQTRDGRPNSPADRAAVERDSNPSAPRIPSDRLPRNSEGDSESVQPMPKRRGGSIFSIPPMQNEPSNSRSTTTPSNDEPVERGTSVEKSKFGKTGVETGNRPIEPPSRQNANRDRPSPRAAQPMTPEPTSATAGDGPKPPQLDVRSELEEKGFAQTLRKIVEQAREESRADSKASSDPSVGDKDAGNGSSKGLESSFVRMLDGIRQDLVRDASKGPTFSTPPPTTWTPTPQPPPPPPAPPSTAGNVMKSVGDFFSQVAAPPDAKPVPPRPSPMMSSSEMSDSQQAGLGSAGPLLMLLAVLGFVWYFLPRVLTSIQSRSHPALTTVGGAIPSADIRTREDVVRAFHRYALHSDMSVPTWWTHREVERQVAEVTPTLQPSIQALANLYEQARYLPDDADFTSDQIGIARRELENVSRANHLG